ncbi:SpoIIE family protein phosphatase [Lamprobacter modestohalophilus]|uniref:SpoIIE family protein phosphatase n=1 Tax=Lamprobacter modestohalophilus TaxID=1064514 RepID=UPI002ADEF067|nr:SpoIIE family protein phosphatase [Lamprobacter modestohalophilus]MEA1051938.1 SpoIIE family protein phosphatase [Lamprobacter modestohalophilus]
MSSLAANLGVALRAMPGESVCGDQIGVWPQAEHRLQLALADGLGHGQGAHQAACNVMRLLGDLQPLAISSRFQSCDEGLLHSRGVALAMADIDLQAHCLTHAAVGNIRSLLLRHGKVRRLGAARGIVGAGYRDLYPEQHDFQAGDWLVMFSDGIGEDAQIADALAQAESNRATGQAAGQTSTQAIAQTLLERWASAHDDASLLLYQHV